jgi:hypothetical protein
VDPVEDCLPRFRVSGVFVETLSGEMVDDHLRIPDDAVASRANPQTGLHVIANLRTAPTKALVEGFDQPPSESHICALEEVDVLEFRVEMMVADDSPEAGHAADSGRLTLHCGSVLMNVVPATHGPNALIGVEASQYCLNPISTGHSIIVR